jgi:hypothetical protein
MNMVLMLVVAMVVALLGVFLATVTERAKRRKGIPYLSAGLEAMGRLATPRNWVSGYEQPRLYLANIAEGTHIDGILTKKTDAAIATRYLLGKFGTDGDHVAVAGAADTPLFVIEDEAGAAEDPVACKVLASCGGTVKMVNDATGAIAVGDVLVAAAGGKVKKIAAGVGNYYVVGIALVAAAADGDVMEVAPVGSWKTQ